ncbi:MAG: EAL domain-containing protein, partial [Oscillospiraceae bacterium]|nr:EAL domain-containing protein [Oscillospiraceae bacterium]
INTIPGHFLNDDDINVLTERYGEYLDSFVYELTEQDTVSDDELNAMRRLGGNSGASQIAIDDYGTGHSNIVNLMRYAPQIIKIDRFLITDIHKDQNKQMFVRSTIEFARLNGIKVLAEGVETSNELRMVIDLGVDLVQGYYTARPAPQPIPAISDDIRKEIQEANPLY